VIELYAIAQRPGPPLPDIAPLRELACGDLGAICGAADDESEITEDALWRHERIVEAVMETRDLLPVRYGTRFARDEEALVVVAARSGALKAALERVRGAVELSLRVRTRQPDVSVDVHASMRPLARESMTRPPADEGELLRAAYLVERSRVPEVRDEVARLQHEHPELSLLLTGPWPPYSFVER
jgi:Gas vesicle synthesis protein GvpL/GvpF